MFKEQEKLERAVMEMILIHKNDPDGIYLNQYLNSQILSREFTGVGFFTKFIIPESLIISSESKDIAEVTATFKDSDIILLFILFIGNGKLDCLEGVVSHECWRYDYENLQLQYRT